MALHSKLQLSTFFLLVFLVYYVSSCEQEKYWQMKLPNVPMPQAIRDNLLHSSGKYEVDNKLKDKAEDVVKPFILGSETKVGTNQPFTVFGWGYDVGNKPKDKAEDVVESLTLNSNKKAGTNQPFTVFGWNYDANHKLKEKSQDVVERFTLDSNTKVGTNQPFTVFGWGYDAGNKPKDKVENVLESLTLDSNKKAGTNQPFTVFGWNYDANHKLKEKSQDVVEPFIHDLNTKVGTNQPYTVFGWGYEVGNNPKGKDEDVVESLSLDSNKKARTNQPFTVFGWKYDANHKLKDKSQSLESNTKVGTNQPFTVFGWNYAFENLKSKAGDVVKAPDMKETSHDHYHHFLNKNKNSNEEDPNGGSLFFVEKSLRLGMILKHDFQKTPKIPFLPKKIAQTIPFKVEKVTDILNLFSLDSESTEGIAIKETLDVCLQRPKVKKENRTCAQSMEDVVDFVVGELGTNDVKVRMMNNNIEVPNGIQDYLITKVKKLEVTNMNGVACHRMSYPYVVYYCHHQKDIGHYDVTLVSPTSGSRPIQTTAVCHYDTYAWQPDVPALQHLGIRPGDAPVCHFSAINDMFWSVKVGSKSLDMVQ